MPTISPHCMDPCVTGFAQSNQIVPGMGAAFRQRFLMVNFFRHHVPAMLQTQFAKRMAGYVSISDLLPGPAVPFFTHRTAFILFVPLGDDLLSGSDSQGRNRVFWVSWATLSPPFGQQKSPADFSARLPHDCIFTGFNLQ